MYCRWNMFFFFLVCRHSLTFCTRYCHALHFLSTINCVDLCGHIRVLSCFIIFPVRWRPSSECSFRRYCHRCRISRRESNIHETEWSVVKCNLSFLVESLQSRIFMNEVGEAFSWTNYITWCYMLIIWYNLYNTIQYFRIRNILGHWRFVTFASASATDPWNSMKFHE